MADFMGAFCGGSFQGGLRIVKRDSGRRFGLAHLIDVAIGAGEGNRTLV